MPSRRPSIVLDTHAWLWVEEGDARADRLRDYSGRVVVSAISVWEIGMLVEKDRLALEPNVDEWVNSRIRPPLFLQPLTPEIALRSSRLPDFHGDPADRMIVATALVAGLPLVTADGKTQSWFADHPEFQDLLWKLG